MVRDFIVNWFVENGSLTKEKLLENLEINYLEAGIVDSFGFLGLIGACEENLNIEFVDEDFSNTNIFSINGLVKIIESKKD